MPLTHGRSKHPILCDQQTRQKLKRLLEIEQENIGSQFDDFFVLSELSAGAIRCPRSVVVFGIVL